MKAFILISLQLIVISFSIFCQCPNPSLKIQSATCDGPINLRIDTVTCSILSVKWQGNQNQIYIIKAMGIGELAGQAYEAAAEKYSCDNNGNCQASIPVKEGSTVNWNVQGVCTQKNSTINSYKVDGKSVSIPFCPQVNITTSKSLHAYPNPTTGSIIVDYNGSVTNSTTFSIFDINGKKAFTISGNAITRTNTGYKLNLPSLTSGTYFLKVNNGQEQSQAKFILFKK